MIYETETLQKKMQNAKYKMTEREIFENYGDLSGDELNKKSNENVYVKNDVMATVIKSCRVEKERRKKNGCIHKKIMIPQAEIPECPELKVKSKIGNIFVNKKILEEYSFKIYEIDPYFYEHYKEKIQANKNRCE